MEQVRGGRDQKQVVALGLVEQGQKEYLRLKRILDSFAGWEGV